IPRRRGYLGEWRYGLLNDARHLDARKLKRTVDRFVALAADPDEPLPAIAAPELTQDADRARAVAAKFGLADTLPVVAICPGAEYGPAKQWPAPHFAALVDRLTGAGY